jgi:tryptophan synthase beta chain
MSQTKILLDEADIPTHWYNVIADMPKPPTPPVGPDGKPLGPEALGAIFPDALLEQEMSGERWIEIPDPVREIYRLWRPSPLFRAHRLEAELGTPAHIYYKYEGVSPAGSHKPNTAVAQAYYNREAGIRRLATETGAGQWGSSLALVGQMFGIDVRVYMVKVSYHQKPYRRSMIHAWGADVLASPSDTTQAGRTILERNPDSQGSLGIAISEAVEVAATNEDTNYSLGSVLNHVMLHQTIIGLETKKQFEKIGETPDVLVGCVGGGSNFAGFTFPYIRDKVNGSNLRIVAVEPTACPTLTRGAYAYDFGDTVQMTPLLKMYTLGHDFVPPGIHAGGLRYHGDSPLVSQLAHEKVIETVAYHQNPVFDAAVLFARSEGIIPAPEAAHAIKGAVDEAVRSREAGEANVIAFNLSGHGHFDMAAYDSYFDKKLEDYELPQTQIDEALKNLPAVGK